MKKKQVGKGILSVILALALVLTTAWVPQLAIKVKAANPTSGACGEGVTWALTENGGKSAGGEKTLTLTISKAEGDETGEMEDFANEDGIPWKLSRYLITDVTIGDGVTHIGKYAFFYCNSLNSVTMRNSVTSIGEKAFYCCGALTSISIPKGVTSVGENAFQDCGSLTTVNAFAGLDLSNAGIDESKVKWYGAAAKVGSMIYETLPAAIAAAQNGATVTLIADVDIDTSLVIEGPLPLTSMVIPSTVE